MIQPHPTSSASTGAMGRTADILSARGRAGGVGTAALIAAALLALAGCAALPAEGPSARAAARVSAAYALVDLDAGAAERLRVAPAAATDSLAGAAAAAPVDVIGVGDTLAIAVFAPGEALFGEDSALPPAVVDRSGAIAVPYAGSVRVAGLTAPQAADAVRGALRGRVANPQVVVAVAAAPSSAVSVLGEVRTPGRIPLTVNADRVLDVIAAAGGPSRAPEEVEVVIRRGEQSWRAALPAVTRSHGENVRLAPGDQVSLDFRPRRYSTFGAVGQAAETDIGAGELTLAGALARAGGLDATRADARSVLVFRFERPEIAALLGVDQPPTPRGVPVIYRLDLSDPAGLFVANRFRIEPEDVIFAPRSGAAEARQFFDFVQSLTRVVYDVSVTSALNLD